MPNAYNARPRGFRPWRAVALGRQESIFFDQSQLASAILDLYDRNPESIWIDRLYNAYRAVGKAALVWYILRDDPEKTSFEDMLRKCRDARSREIVTLRPIAALEPWEIEGLWYLSAPKSAENFVPDLSLGLIAQRTREFLRSFGFAVTARGENTSPPRILLKRTANNIELARGEFQRIVSTYLKREVSDEQPTRPSEEVSEEGKRGEKRGCYVNRLQSIP